MQNTSLAISPVDLPAESRISGFYKSVNLADACAISLPDSASCDPEALARCLFPQSPRCDFS